MDMEIEGGINNFENDWWYEFGISFHLPKVGKLMYIHQAKTK